MTLEKSKLVLEAALENVLNEGMEPEDVVSFVQAYLASDLEQAEQEVAAVVLAEPPPDICPDCEGSGNGAWSQERAERVWKEFAEQFGGTVEEAREQLGTIAGFEPCPRCEGHGRLAPPNVDAPPLIVGEREEEPEQEPQKLPVYELIEAAYPLIPDASKIEIPDESDRLVLRTTDADYLYALADYWTGGRTMPPSDRVRQNGVDGKARARLVCHAARTAATQLGWLRPGVRRDAP